MIQLAPSILAADLADLKNEVKIVQQAGAEYIHIDVMDGMFVPNITLGVPVIASLRKSADITFDVHLMIEEPVRYVEAFKSAGADIITVHAEACKHLDRTIMAIKELGIMAGVALNPATPLSVLQYVPEQIDMVVIMSVNPGFGNQKYIKSATEKLKELKAMHREKGLNAKIEVDGGITLENVREVIEAGADVIVAGTSVYQGNVEENVKAFLKIFNEYSE